MLLANLADKCVLLRELRRRIFWRIPCLLRYICNHSHEVSEESRHIQPVRYSIFHQLKEVLKLHESSSLPRVLYHDEPPCTKPSPKQNKPFFIMSAALVRGTLLAGGYTKFIISKLCPFVKAEVRVVDIFRT